MTRELDEERQPDITQTDHSYVRMPFCYQLDDVVFNHFLPILESSFD